MGWVIVVVKCASVGCFCIVWGGGDDDSLWGVGSDIVSCSMWGCGVLVHLGVRGVVFACGGVGCLYIGVTGCSCYVGVRGACSVWGGGDDDSFWCWGACIHI